MSESSGHDLRGAEPEGTMRRPSRERFRKTRKRHAGKSQPRAGCRVARWMRDPCHTATTVTTSPGPEQEFKRGTPGFWVGVARSRAVGRLAAPQEAGHFPQAIGSPDLMGKVNEAIRADLARPGGFSGTGSLGELRPRAYPDGNERLSENVDSVARVRRDLRRRLHGPRGCDGRRLSS
jgi:hypothetical protein